MKKHPRIIGTTLSAIAAAEAHIGRAFPLSHRDWLIQNNGMGIEEIEIFPVFDERDSRKTWNSIVRENETAKSYWAEVFGDEALSFDDLLPFASFGTGDYYCFDYSVPTGPGEFQVVLVSHETGERRSRAQTFAQFAQEAAAGAYGDD